MKLLDSGDHFTEKLLNKHPELHTGTQASCNRPASSTTGTRAFCNLTDPAIANFIYTDDGTILGSYKSTGLLVGSS